MTENLENQSEMSMEDILSSIKGILSENEAEQKSESIQNIGAPAQAEEKAENDDVFDLSSSMIVDDIPDTSHEPTANLGLPEIEDSDSEFWGGDDKSKEDDELPELPSIADSEIDINSKSEDNEIFSTDFAKEKEEEKDISDKSLDELTQLMGEENTDSVINKEIPENGVSPTSVDDILAQINEGVVSATEKNKEQPITETQASSSIPVDENFDPADMHMDEFSEILEEETEKKFEISEPREIPLPSQEEKKLQETEKPEDISEDIIDNFAEMFTSNTSPQKQVEEAKASTTIGNSGKTMEEMVKEVIAESLRPVIKEAISKMDEKILEVVRAEVAAQAKAWINNNLSKEVEQNFQDNGPRVTEKVGS